MIDVEHDEHEVFFSLRKKGYLYMRCSRTYARGCSRAMAHFSDYLISTYSQHDASTGHRLFYLIFLLSFVFCPNLSRDLTTATTAYATHDP